MKPTQAHNTTRTNLNSRGRVVGITEVVGLVPQPATNVPAVGEKTGGREANVFVHRLYAAVGALDQELGVEETLDTEDNTVRATDTDGNAGVG